jgi:hypothetical protein
MNYLQIVFLTSLSMLPASMGIEIYNNTFNQISASIESSPNGATVPAGINLVYSSKDHLTEGNFDNQYATHVGNLFYAHGLGVITNQDYQMIFPLPPIAKNDYGSFLTTDTKTISASLNDYARSGTLNTSSLALSGSTSGDGYSWATGSNGTIVLTTTVAGTYSIYYTTGANIAGTTPDTVGVRPQNMPKRKKLPKSPVMMKLKRNGPNDFK